MEETTSSFSFQVLIQYGTNLHGIGDLRSHFKQICEDYVCRSAVL